MKIIYKYGDLFKSDEIIIMHGCNTKAVFGSGVAKIVKELHPLAYEGYRKKHEMSGLNLGEVIWVKSKGIVIGNAITQENYGRDKNTIYCDYDAIRSVIKNANKKSLELNVKTIGLPTIGAGLANGSWKTISKIIEEESENFIPVVYLIDEIPKG